MRPNPATRALCATAFVLLVQCVLPATGLAHGGRLDKHGCHHDRKNGGYHCHRGPGANAPRPAHRPAYRPADTPAPLDHTTPRFDLSPGKPRRSASAYRNCTESRAAGAAPVHRGEPGYGPHLDRDNDGIGCEPYRGR